MDLVVQTAEDHDGGEQLMPIYLVRWPELYALGRRARAAKGGRLETGQRAETLGRWRKRSSGRFAGTVRAGASA